MAPVKLFNMSKPAVLFIGDLNRDLPEYKKFAEKYECIDYEVTSKEQAISDLKSKFSHVQAIYGSWLGFMKAGGFRNELLAAAPPDLKAISICSVGYDGYDGAAMAEKNIVLTNVPSTSSSEAVANLVLYHALGSFRNLYLTQQVFVNDLSHTLQARAGLQYGKFDSATGTVKYGDTTVYAYGESAVGIPNQNPAGHNAVVIGFGQIGKTIGQKLAAVGMNIHYVKRNKLSAKEEAELPYKVTYHPSLAEAKDIADFVVIAAPGTPETKHMINDELINLFPKPFRLVNVGRGSIVDENALVKGLQLGKVLYAGLDVFEEEPHVHPGLLKRLDVVLTPHIGASTKEDFDYTAVQAIKNIDDILEGGRGFNRVN